MKEGTAVLLILIACMIVVVASFARMEDDPYRPLPTESELRQQCESTPGAQFFTLSNGVTGCISSTTQERQ